ncbi:MAG: outer membrane beta-barrel domain-containing protein [Gammaproteobacteria bacterium]|nr:outer membrane beta-barrel domain-containing protein [Gammaproteobacteria bacterium]
MESRIRSIFLTMVRFSCCILMVISGTVAAQEADAPPQVIESQVERRDLNVGAIDTEDFELTGFVGLMSVEDFESSAVYGARLAYHISPAFFAEGSYGTTDVGSDSFERQTPGANTLSDRTLNYYDLSLGWNVLQGESFVGSTRAWNSVFYVIAGVGSTDFAGDDQFTANFGFGFKFLPTDSFSVRFDVRDYMFDLDVTGTDKTTHNMQMTLNLGWFF